MFVLRILGVVIIDIDIVAFWCCVCHVDCVVIYVVYVVVIRVIIVVASAADVRVAVRYVVGCCYLC